MPSDEKYLLSDKRLMEIGSLTPPHTTKDEWVALYRLARIGQWYEDAFVCRFGPEYAAPLPQGPMLLGARCRLQMEDKNGGWLTLFRRGNQRVGFWGVDPDDV